MKQKLMFFRYLYAHSQIKVIILASLHLVCVLFFNVVKHVWNKLIVFIVLIFYILLTQVIFFKPDLNRLKHGQKTNSYGYKPRCQVGSKGKFQLLNLTKDPITLKSLSASPGKYIRCFSHILYVYEEKHPYGVRKIPLPRPFSLFPSPSFKWRYISINVNALSGLINKSVPRGYRNQLDLFQESFDFDKLKTTVETPNGENNILFNNYIRPDGFAVDFLFNKRNQPGHSIENHDLTMQDFEYNEVVTSYRRPTFIDPGRKAVFTAVVDLDGEH